MTNYQVAITNDILNLISELDEFKGRWQAINTLSLDRLSLLKKSATIESIFFKNLFSFFQKFILFFLKIYSLAIFKIFVSSFHSSRKNTKIVIRKSYKRICSPFLLWGQGEMAFINFFQKFILLQFLRFF